MCWTWPACGALVRGWVRYGDDLLVVAAGPLAATAAQAALDQAAAASGLRIHPGKTRVYAGDGTWPVLGQRLRVDSGAPDGQRVVVGPRPKPRRSVRPTPPRPSAAAAPPHAAAGSWLTRPPWARMLFGDR